MALNVTQHITPPTLTVVIDGELSMVDAPDFKNAVKPSLATPGLTEIIFDMRGCAYLDSSGLGALFFIKKSADPKCHVVLKSPIEQVKKVLQLSGMDKIFTLQD